MVIDVVDETVNNEEEKKKGKERPNLSLSQVHRVGVGGINKSAK